MKRKPIVRASTRAALLCGLSLAGAVSAFAQTGTTSVTPATGEALAARIAALKASGSSTTAITPQALGNYSNDLVYTPVTPCRIVDSRVAGGALVANTSKQYDVDGTTFASQGGNNGSCGIPSGVSYAVAMTITAVNPSAKGYFTAYGYSGPKPNSSVVNFTAGQNVANTTIVPVLPGGGVDFTMVSSVNSDIVIDVVGYFAPPTATALDCTNVASATTSIPVNTYTSVDANCPAGYTVTGGGTFPVEGTLGRPQIWTDGSPNAASGNGWRVWVDNQASGSRSIQVYARCCRVPGR